MRHQLSRALTLGRSPEPEFDEAAYLAAHEDVRKEVAAGRLSSGRDHYEAFGKAEGRALSPSVSQPRSRRERLLSGLDVATMVGVEIGPLTAPLVSKNEGRIVYIDHATTEQLREKYACDTKVNLADIVEVDRVWGGNSLQDCVGAEAPVDYVLATHVIEHVPDIVTWLREIDSILKPTGTVRLAIPDRRFTFDILRNETTLADALDAYVRRARIPGPRAILDHFLNYVEVDALAVWNGRVDTQFLRPAHSVQFALEAAERSFRSGDYQDTHCWVFTPTSFVDLALALARCGLLRLACERLFPTLPFEIEFIAVLRPASDQTACVDSWAKAAAQMKAQAEPIATVASS